MVPFIGLQGRSDEIYVRVCMRVYVRVRVFVWCHRCIYLHYINSCTYRHIFIVRNGFFNWWHHSLVYRGDLIRDVCVRVRACVFAYDAIDAYIYIAWMNACTHRHIFILRNCFFYLWNPSLVYRGELMRRLVLLHSKSFTHKKIMHYM